MRLGLKAWPGFSRLVNRDDPELVPLALAEAGHAGLQLVYRRAAVVVVRYQRVKPACS